MTVEVWMRPAASVTGIRWTRCTPRSNFSRLQAPLPWTAKTTSLKPPWPVRWLPISSIRQRWRSAYFAYIRNRSAAKRAASSPPAPARISTKTLFSSAGSLGRSSARSCCSRVVSARPQIDQLGVGQLPQLGVPAVVAQDVLGFLDAGEHALVGAEGGDDLFQLGPRLGQPGVLGAAARRAGGGLGELSPQVLVPTLDRAQLIEHRRASRDVGDREWASPDGNGSDTPGARDGHRGPACRTRRYACAGGLRPYLRWKRSTRPAVSTSFCLPVKKG